MLKDSVYAAMMTKDGTRCSGQRVFVASCNGMAMLLDVVSVVMYGLMIMDITSCSGMYANALGCGMCSYV